MAALERLQTAGQPRPEPSIEKAVELICSSTIAQRAGYIDKEGKVQRGNVELAVFTAAMLDLPIIKAIDWVYIVNNVPQLYAATMRVLARRQGYDLDFPDAEQTDESGTAYIRFGERGAWRKVTFTIEQANKAGLTTKDNWKYLRDMLTQRACTRAISRYAPEVLAGMSAAGVWPDTEEEQPATPPPTDQPTIAAAEREPDIDDDDLAEILDRVHQLPPDQYAWFGRRWKDDLGCPNLHRRRWLRASHGALARYMLDEAEKAAEYAARLDDAVADAVPAEDGYRYDPDDPGRPFTTP